MMPGMNSNINRSYSRLRSRFCRGTCIIGLITAMMLSSCSLFVQPKEEVAVARVYNTYLTRADLDGLVPKGMSPADSAAMVKRYVANWIRQQIFLQHAMNNLPPEKMDFERTIQDYKNSLIIYTYESELVKKHLDNTLSEAQIRDYYEENKMSFSLRENIVKVIYVKVPLDAPDINQLRRLYRSTDEDQMDRLETYCLDHAASYYLDINTWMRFADIMKDTPINTANPESWLRNNKSIELTDEYYRYFLYIVEYKLKGDESPLAFERDNIRSLLLNQRKHAFINDQRDLFFQEALKNGDFEVYY
jgi:hypothetical protein